MYNYQPTMYNPYAYPQQYPQQYPQPVQPQASTIAFVEGDAGAQSLYVEPGKTGMAMDIKQMIVYLKSVDVSGVPNTRKFKMEEITEPTPDAADPVEYAKLSDLQSLQKDLTALSKSVRALKRSMAEENDNDE